MNIKPIPINVDIYNYNLNRFLEQYANREKGLAEWYQGIKAELLDAIEDSNMDEITMMSMADKIEFADNIELEDLYIKLIKDNLEHDAKFPSYNETF